MSNTIFHGPDSTSEAGLISECGTVLLSHADSGCLTLAMRKATRLDSFVFRQWPSYSMVEIRAPAAHIVRTGINCKVDVDLLIFNFQCFYIYSNKEKMQKYLSLSYPFLKTK